MSNNLMSDIENTNIIINPGKSDNYPNIPENSNNNSNRLPEKDNSNNQKNFMENLIQNQTAGMAKNVIDNAGENIKKKWYKSFSCCNIDFLKPYFDITTEELKERLKHSLIPFNPKFYDISQKNPDLYGPFWIYTTLIFVIAASGSLTKQLNGDSSDQFFQEFVPFAATLVKFYLIFYFLDLWNWFYLADCACFFYEVFWN